MDGKMRLALFFLAALAWGQEASPPAKYGPDAPKSFEQQIAKLQQQLHNAQQLAENFRQAAQESLDAYRGCVVSRAQIEQQVAPAKPPRVEPSKSKEEKK